MIVEWHPEAVNDLARLDRAVQQRIFKAVEELQGFDDPRQRMAAYTATLKGFWKLRVGDYRLVCQFIERNGQVVLIVHVAHRSVAYDAKSVRTTKSRSQD